MLEKQRPPVPVQLAAILAAMRSTSDWNRPLARALALRSGEQLLTLREAADYLTHASQSAHDLAPLQQAIAFLFQAAQSGAEADRKAATDQVALMLKQKGLM